MRLFATFLVIGLIFWGALFVNLAVGEMVEVDLHNPVAIQNELINIEQDVSATRSGILYKGLVRVYIVEGESRWQDFYFFNYHNALLSYAFDDSLNLDYLESFQETRVWDGADFGFADVTAGNLKAIAVVFNAHGNINYSYPEHPFMAYPADACAIATNGNPGSHTYGNEFTHTVFVEEGTASW